MSFEEEFDRKINQKMDEASFPFDEANWAKASAMLDVERKVGGGGFSKIYVPLVAIGLVSLSLVALSYFNTANETLTANTQPKNLVNASLNTPIQKEQPTIGKELSLTNTSDQPALTVIAETPAKTTDAKTASVKSEQLPEKRQPESKLSRNEVNVKTEEVKPDNTTVAGLASEASPAIVAETTGVEKQAPVPQAESTLPGAISGIQTESAPVAKSNEEGNLTNGQTLNSSEHTKVAGIKENEAINMETQLQNPIIEQMVLRELYLSGNETDIISVPFVLLPRYDEDYFKKTNKPLRHFMNVEAGALYNLGWANTGNQGRDGQGANWFAGLNYGYYLGKKVAIGMGLQVFNISHINQPFYEASSKQYNFGSSTSGTMVTSNQVYFASVPIKLYYSLNTKNRLGLGFNAAYAFNALSTVKTYTETQETVKTEFPVQTTKGVYQGTNPFNYMLSAFYKFQLSRRVALNAEYTYGLTDLFKNTGNINTAEKPQGLRLSINYTLFEK